MTLLGLERTAYVVVMTVLTFGTVPAHIWPFVNLCPRRGTFPMVPGCRLFCLCYRPGGAGRLLACPEDMRFNPEQERCTDDPEVCEEHKLCDPPALLEKAELLAMKDIKTECDTTGMTYCANRWELVVCHPVWSHTLGVIDCDRHGDGNYICNLMTDSCERNRSALWDSLGGIDSGVFGTAPGEECEGTDDDEYPEESALFSTMCCPPTLCRIDSGLPAVGSTSSTEESSSSDTGQVQVDECDTIDHFLPDHECKAAGSWCLPDLETIVTCGEKKKIRQVRSCKDVFAKGGLDASCHPIVFGCAYWPQKPDPASWAAVSKKYPNDHRKVESYGGWFRERWCKSHGVRGFVCAPDGSTLAHCNESLMVDAIFDCESFEPERALLGCQYCEPGTAFCIYRPRADLADACGVPPPNDNHRAMCGFLTRTRRRAPELRVRRDFVIPYSTTRVVRVRRSVVAEEGLGVTKRSML